jgi:hypothetical protein
MVILTLFTRDSQKKIHLLSRRIRRRVQPFVGIAAALRRHPRKIGSVWGKD